MDEKRRNAIKFSTVSLIAGWMNVAGRATAAARTADVASHDPLPLGEPGFCLPVASLQGADRSITDYSGFHYCPAVDALLLFGGGHAATPEDVLLRFPMDTLAWSADYAATPKETMLERLPDGQYRYLTPGKFWKVPGQTPVIRPISRHTYSGFVWSSAIQRMILPMGNNGTYYGFTNQTTGGNVAEYDPVTRTWEDAGTKGCAASLAYCEDPVTGFIIAQDQGTFRVYDPRARQWVVDISLNAVPYFGYSANVVYYPPNDRFYYIGRNIDPSVDCPRMWEYRFDRTALRPIYSLPNGPDRGLPMVTNWRPHPRSGGMETGYTYDQAHELIVGSLLPGVMLGFRPNADGTGTWMQHPAPGTTQQVFYCIAYVPRLNAHFVICDVLHRGKTTFAFRWNAAQASIPTAPAATQDPNAVSQPDHGIAATVTRDVDLRRHPDVLAYLEFRDFGTVLQDLGRSNWSDSRHRPWFAISKLPDGRTFPVDDPEFMLENGLSFMRFSGGNVNTRLIAAHLFAPPGVRHAFCRYVLVIEPDVPEFMTELGVKLPGFEGMYADTVLHPPHAGTHTFSWRMEHGPKNNLAVRDYLYDGTTGSGYGNIKDYGLVFPVGVPITVEQELNVDTQAGRVWIDGRLAGERTVVTDVDIEELFLNVYHGGMRKAAAPIHYRLAAACIAKTYIGPPVELASSIAPVPDRPKEPRPFAAQPGGPHLPPASQWLVEPPDSLVRVPVPPRRQ